MASDSKLKGFRYDGTFPLGFLRRHGEMVRANGDRGGCQIVIGDFEKTLNVDVGDFVARDENGRIVVIGPVAEW